MSIEAPLLWKFDRDFRAYVNASIAYAEVQEPYQPLDFEAEMRWIKEWLRENANPKDGILEEMIETVKTNQ